MRKIIFVTFLIVLSVFAVFSQTNKTKKIQDLDESISKIEKQLQEKITSKELLLIRFTEKYSEVVKIQSEIDLLVIELALLNKEKKDILLAERLKNLPNNQIELLKIIITQNEKIIELLEKLQKP